jgi:hypothetical protein
MLRRAKLNHLYSLTLSLRNLTNCNCVFGIWEKYAASTYTSHIRIPLNYFGLLKLQSKLNDRLDNFFTTLYNFNFHVSEFYKNTLNSTFQLYKGNTNEIFKLFNDLLVSLPHVLSQQQRQWDIASFIVAMSALTLATYNTVQIS